MAGRFISGEQYFKDFSFAMTNWSIVRDGTTLFTVKGLENKDEHGTHIEMLYGCDIQVGDTLIDYSTRLVVTKVEIDTYQGEPSVVKAYY